MERIVSLTSWPKRIHGVKATIDSVRRFRDEATGNVVECKDVHVVLTLSEEEFPDHDIPETGADEIIWVPKNTGPFKKVLHTMAKYPDEPVISIDDDVIYNNVVDLLWNKHLMYPKCVITNFPNVKRGKVVLPNGYCTLYPPHSLDGALEMLTKKIIDTKTDDTFYGLVLLNNQVEFRYLMSKKVAIFREGNIGLHLLRKYHGNEDVKKIVGEMYWSEKFHPDCYGFNRLYDKMFFMNRKEYNIRIFNSTMEMIKESPELTTAVQKSIEGQEYYSGDIQSPTADRFDEPCRVMVSPKRTLRAARILCKRKDGKVAILNFASATRPGGGVANGSHAQEEALCRVSTLYKCLSVDEAERQFYKPHRDNPNPLHNDDLIYTPGVVFFKNDHADPLAHPIKVDVISCSAPNLRPPKKERNPVSITDDELYAIHVSRGRQILNAAVLHGIDYIVLGAFGCGVFMNDPNVVARAYSDLIKDYMKQFKRIEFAIYCRKDQPENYVAFKTKLNGLNIEIEDFDDEEESQAEDN